MSKIHWMTRAAANPHICKKCGWHARAITHKIKQNRPETEMVVSAHNDPRTGRYCPESRKVIAKPNWPAKVSAKPDLRTEIIS